jgi:hypothetical protein
MAILLQEMSEEELWAPMAFEGEGGGLSAWDWRSRGIVFVDFVQVSRCAM